MLKIPTAFLLYSFDFEACFYRKGLKMIEISILYTFMTAYYLGVEDIESTKKKLKLNFQML